MSQSREILNTDSAGYDSINEDTKKIEKSSAIVEECTRPKFANLPNSI
jgi:hypothetical protein